MKNSETKVSLRVDASMEIGTGHFMRCLALADALKVCGSKTRFVSRHLPEHLRSKLAMQGHELVLIDTSQNDIGPDELTHARWLGVSQIQDAKDSIQALSDANWDWLIVDHYALSSRWESKLRQVVKSILVIDDIADRQHDCEILLDQNYYADMEARYIGKVPAHCQLLLGPRYALLRDKFQKLHSQVEPRRGSVRRVLVFFGGVDADNYTGRSIEALSELDVTGIQVDVVIGAQHPYKDQIEATCAQLGFICHVQTDRMADLMAVADLAIGAGGSAVWERCCLGLPTLAFCTADNQQRQLADAARGGLLFSPELPDGLERSIQRQARALIEDSKLRQFISNRGMEAVDGKGISRVISSMGCGIEIRPARLDDSENLFKWRNHPSIRAASRNANVIEWQDHQRWLVSVLSDAKKMLLIGQHGGLPVGVVRFDIQGGEAEISIYLVPEESASGLGRGLLRSAEQWIAAKCPEINRIHAHVLGANERSQRLFLGAGYQVDSASFSKRLH